MKTLQQVVTEIKSHDVSRSEAREFAEKDFGQIYAWVKADVVARMLKELKTKKSKP